MTNWKSFETKNNCPTWDQAPNNWCFLSSGDKNHLVLGKWSYSSFCWIGMNLTKLELNIDEFMETSFPTLQDLLYSRNS